VSADLSAAGFHLAAGDAWQRCCAVGLRADRAGDIDARAGNSRNGYGRKSVVTDTGRIALEVHRLTNGHLRYSRYFRHVDGNDRSVAVQPLAELLAKAGDEDFLRSVADPLR
jgi:hypothetical protein